MTWEWLRTLYEVSHAVQLYILSKFAFIILMMKKSLSMTTNEMQECPRISTMSKKDQILEKNGLNAKLKRRKV